MKRIKVFFQAYNALEDANVDDSCVLEVCEEAAKAFLGESCTTVYYRILIERMVSDISTLKGYDGYSVDILNIEVIEEGG